MEKDDKQNRAKSRRFRPYPKYKDSGIEWLGKIPAGWETRRLKFLLAEPLKYGANETAELDDPDLPRYVRITDIDAKDGLREETFKSLPADVAEEYLLREGDLLFARSGATAGKTFLYRRSWGTCAYAGYLIRARLDLSRVFPEFARYFTAASSYWHWLSAVFIQSTIQNVSAERYASLVMPQPSYPEQRAIAAFLDRETAKIDALIEKKERLIELLQEKRSALITQAVTKGLDPTVPMKDSGIEWLGKIPTHWDIKRFRYVGEAIIGLTYEPVDVVEPDEGILVLRASNVCDGHIVLDDNVFVKRLIPTYLITKVGDILICARSGSRALIGKSAKIDTTCAGLTFGAFMIVFRSIYNDYLFYTFNSTLFNFQSGAFLTSTINQLTLSNLKSFYIPMPPHKEQSAIAAYLDSETGKIDALVAKVREVITSLQEYRTALISAAVTGKIDMQEIESA